MKKWFVVLMLGLMVAGPAFAQALAVATNPTSGTYAYADGGSFTFDATASGGTAPYTYKWAKDGTANYISGATTSILTIDPLDTDDAGTYYAEVTDDVSAVITSDPIEAQIMTLATTPASGTHDYQAGSSFTFSVVATDGITPYTYQWMKDGTATAIAGATTSVLTIDPLDAADAGTYYVNVEDDVSAVLLSDPIVATISMTATIAADEVTPVGMTLDSGTTTIYETTTYEITDATTNTFLYVSVTGDAIKLSFVWNQSSRVTKKIWFANYQIPVAAGDWILGPFPKDMLDADKSIKFTKTSSGTDTTVVKPMVAGR